jgi:hypothetical protein
LTQCSLLGTPSKYNVAAIAIATVWCSKGTPITKKAQPLPFIKGGTTKEEKKTKVLTQNKYRK